MQKGAQCQHGLQKVRADKLLRVHMSIALAAADGPIGGLCGVRAPGAHHVFSLQIYGSEAHGVCKITGGSAAKIQGFRGVPGGSGGFRLHTASLRHPKMRVWGTCGGGSSACAKHFKIKKREPSRTHDHGGAVERGWLLEFYASPLLGPPEFYASCRCASRPTENKHTSL